MILIVLSFIMGYLGLNIGGMIGPELTMYLFGIVGVLSPGLFTLEQIHREVKKKLSYQSEESLDMTEELGLVKLQDMDVLSNTQLEEVIEIYKKKAIKKDDHQQYQKYEGVLKELKEMSYFTDEQFSNSLDKLKNHFNIL